MSQLLIRFGGSDAASLGIPDGQGYFAIPENVKGLTTRPVELLELTSLSNGLALWTVRHALTMPVYAANPIAAVRQPNNELSSLADQFRTGSGEKGGLDLDRMIDLTSIHTRDELTARLQSLREFSSFLDERAPLPVKSEAYTANTSISKVPLEVLVEQRGADRFYGATTLPGLIGVWKHTKNGELALKGLSVGE